MSYNECCCAEGGSKRLGPETGFVLRQRSISALCFVLMRRLLGLGQISVSVFNLVSRPMPAATGSTAISSAISAVLSS